jgi:L-threonylcarbamoyladenylate synthase
VSGHAATVRLFREAGLSQIERAVSHLRAGRLVAFPTETVYGLGADATSEAAVRKIFAAKGRPPTNPLIVHVADVETARRYTTHWCDAAQTLAAAWWPGPLTLVLPKTGDVPDVVSAGRGTVGLRAPDHPLALELLGAFGGALAAPSANRSNRVSPTTAQHVRDELGDAVDLILDGGPCAVGIESTVLDLSGERPRILRPGAVTRRQIEFIVGPVDVASAVTAETVPAASPGQHAVHYAPRTRAVRFDTPQRGLIHVDTRDGRPNGLIAVGTMRDCVKKWGRVVAMPREPALYARHLYEVVRELDGMGLATIFIEMPPDTPEWAAVRDRVTRATVPMPAGGGG